MYCSTASSCLGRKAEDLLYKGSLRRHVTPGHCTHLSLGQHRHCFHPGQRPLRRPEALKAEHGPGQALDPALVLLDPVVEPAPTPVPGEAPQLALLLHLAQPAGIALEAIGDDLARVAVCSRISALFGFWTEGRAAVLVGYMRLSMANQIA